MFFWWVKFIKQGEKRETPTKPCNETMLRDKLRIFVSRISPPLKYHDQTRLLLRTIELMLFWTFTSANLRPPLIIFVPSLGENLRKWRHFVKNTTRVEIIIISAAIRIKNFDSYIRAIYYIVTIISTRPAFMREWTLFSRILNQAVNSWK